MLSITATCVVAIPGRADAQSQPEASKGQASRGAPPEHPGAVIPHVGICKRSSGPTGVPYLNLLKMKRPTSITVIGAIFILAGCLAAWQIVYGLFHDHLYLNFSVLMIPVGFGLLKGRSSSIGWAKFWIGLFSLIFGLLLFCYPFFGDSYSVTWFEDQLVGFPRHVVAVGFPIVFLLIASWMWRRLTGPSNSPFFNDHRNQNAQHAVGGNRR